jgi:hypothetical protein
LVVLAALAFGLPFASAAGRYAADTRAPLYFAPAEYLQGALSVWQPAPYLGHQQHDGLLVPMGVVVGLLRGVGLSVWVAERLWHGLLLFTAGLGMVLLVDTFRGRSLSVAHPLAAAAYAFNPFTLAIGVQGTGAWLVPYAVLPLLLTAVARGLRRPRGWFAPALVALAAFAMGGGNGAPQVYAAIPVLAYIAWSIFVARTASARAALAFTAKALALTVGLSLYWLVGLTGQQVTNDIAFSEQPETINVSSSYSESLRLLGFWGYYGGDRFGPWFPTIQPLFRNPLVVLTSFAVPIAALALAAVSRWRERLLFVLLGTLSVVTMAGIFPPDGPTPFGRLLLAAYDGVPGAVGLRTTYKMAPVLALAVAVLFGMGVQELRGRWSRGRERSWGHAVLGGAAFLLAANAFPLWTGNLYADYRTVRSVPAYWDRAIAALEHREDDHRILFVPGTLQSFYRWGGLIGGLAEINPELSALRRPGIAVTGRHANNLLAALEQPYQGGPSSQGAVSTLLRYLGVRYVVIQNDIDWARSQTARPAELQVLTEEPGVELLATYGFPGENVLGPGGLRDLDLAARLEELSIPPVQVLELGDPSPVIRAVAGPGIVLSGDAFSLFELAGAGLLDTLPTVLYSGDLSDRDLLTALGDGASVVVSDGNRRRARRLAAMRGGFSHTLTAGERPAAGPVGFGMFDEDVDTQTVAVYQGVRSVDASGYGSPFLLQPQYRPALALDGDPTTAWVVGGFADPVGEWIRVDLPEPTRLSSIELLPHDRGPNARRVSAVVLEFSDGIELTAQVQDRPTVVAFRPRTVSWVRVHIAGVVNGGDPSPVGFDEIRIPGLEFREYLRLPVDLMRRAASSEEVEEALRSVQISYLFARARSDTEDPDEERGLRRMFEVPYEAAFDLQGQARLDPAALDEDIDRLVLGPTEMVATSSGRLFGSPEARASAALDGDVDTAWQAPGVGETWIEVRFPVRLVDSVSLKTVTDEAHAPVRRVVLSFSDGSTVAHLVPPDGETEVSFPERAVSWVRVSIDVLPLPGAEALPVGISELSIPGVEFPHPPRAGDALGCYTGPGLTLDGRPLPMRPVGTVGELLAGEALPLLACEGEVLLDAGAHRFDQYGVLQPDWVLLRPGEVAPWASPEEVEVEVLADGPTEWRLRVEEADRPFFLVLGQNWAPGWRATVDGRSLGPPLVLNGYSAGWRVDPGERLDITVTYGPQQRFELALAVSVATLILVSGVVAWGVWRRR